MRTARKPTRFISNNDATVLKKEIGPAVGVCGNNRAALNSRINIALFPACLLNKPRGHLSSHRCSAAATFCFSNVKVYEDQKTLTTSPTPFASYLSLYTLPNLCVNHEPDYQPQPITRYLVTTLKPSQSGFTTFIRYIKTTGRLVGGSQSPKYE